MADKEVQKIQFFSRDTNKLYQLYGEPPTLKISGVPMHRHIKMTPLQDTQTKIDALRPKGIVLDTCMGLGYTSIFSARRKEVEKVMVFEKDHNVVEIAQLNPYSKEFFENPKIGLVEGDVFEKVKELPTAHFDSVMHDPPTFSLATELYSQKFHHEIHRIMKNNARLWHYCPDPGKLSGKSKLSDKIIMNLKQTGFRNIRYDAKSCGILAEK